MKLELLATTIIKWWGAMSSGLSGSQSLLSLSVWLRPHRNIPLLALLPHLPHALDHPPVGLTLLQLNFS